MEIKKNLPLIVALAIPVVLTAVIAVAVYLPGFGEEPKHDFIYVVRNYYGSGPSYNVVNGKIVENTDYFGAEESAEIPAKSSITQSAQLYYYDLETKSSKGISVQEAQSYTLETSRTSPDGYILQSGSRGGFFPFEGNYSYNQYLVGHNRRVETTISDYDFQFLGWVK